METQKQFTMVRHSDLPESINPNIQMKADLNELSVFIKWKGQSIWVHANEFRDFIDTFKQAAEWVAKLGD